jgi:hypothetical protein
LQFQILEATHDEIKIGNYNLVSTASAPTLSQTNQWLFLKFQMFSAECVSFSFSFLWCICLRSTLVAPNAVYSRKNAGSQGEPNNQACAVKEQAIFCQRGALLHFIHLLATNLNFDFLVLIRFFVDLSPSQSFLIALAALFVFRHFTAVDDASEDVMAPEKIAQDVEAAKAEPGPPAVKISFCRS